MLIVNEKSGLQQAHFFLLEQMIRELWNWYIMTNIHHPTKSNRHSLKFTSKTYEILFFSKISIVRITMI